MCDLLGRGAASYFPTSLKLLAVPEGLEPPTLALGKPCSIRLSYGTAWAAY
jgi:hypothetical protein